MASGVIIAKEPVVLSGLEVAEYCFKKVNSGLNVKSSCQNGQKVPAGTILMEITGHAQSILKAERVALNFLGRLCGIATLTDRFVEKLKGTTAQLLDTRKSTPGLRALEKAAVANGGARNHRMGLSDGVMLKENHIRAAGGITKAMSALLESLPPTLKVEVETTNLDEVQEALDAGADIIMLDNMSLAEMEMAVRTIRGRALVEASGNVTLDRLREIASTGVDFISTGAIMHSARWVDLSLLFSTGQRET
jgi:nicotinate-nucleotide pyrophosphorylase (carboxylating)